MVPTSRSAVTSTAVSAARTALKDSSSTWRPSRSRGQNLDDNLIVLFDLTSDQEVFRETTARFLDDQVPVAELRRLRDDPAGFDEKYWRGGADLGWTSLLVSESDGGGTISDNGVIDLTLVA